MPVYGQGRKKILVLGEAPGKDEDEQGRPFVGKSGEYLRRALGECGINLDKDAWTTNALICRPPRNATPDNDQIGYCRPNVLNALDEVKPNVVITLGRVALVSLLKGIWTDDVGPMERWAGWKIPHEKFWICPTYHPSFLLRMENRLMDRLFNAHVEAAFDLEPPPALRQPNISVLYNPDEIEQHLKEIDEEEDWTSVDYETNCLKPEYPKAEPVSFAVGNQRRNISYPLNKTTLVLTGEFLRSKKTRKIASNIKMEERWTLSLFGHGVRNWGWDTMLAAHVLDNRQGICSLKFQSFVKLGFPSYNTVIEPYLGSPDGSHYNRIKEISMDTLLKYGAMDVFLETWLAEVQRAEMGFAE